MRTLVARWGIVWQMLLPIPVISGLAILGAAFLVPHFIASSAVQDASEQAQQTVKQFKVLRAYYTTQVVAKVKKSSTMKIGIAHRNNPDMIPLPATMIQDLSALLAKQGTTLRLYSPYPFPNRANRKLDAFESAAWNLLSKHPDRVFQRQQDLGGKDVLRVAVADRMVSQDCVNCHNTFPGSPKTDWKLGDVRGVLEVDSNLGPALARGSELTHIVMIGAGLIAGLLSLVAVLLARRIGSLIKAMTAAMKRLAEGDRSIEVPAQDRGDEIGDMARAVEVFKRNAEENDRLVAAKAREQAARDRRQAAMDRHTEDFGTSVSGVMQSLVQSAAEMRKAATAMSDAAARSRQTTSDAVGSVNTASRDLNSVAVAAEQMAASIHEISQQVTHVTHAVRQAVDRASETDTKVAGLAVAADRIGEVVQLITDIAGQTNLLALNATIEAARAGEAGKGFAVVASEVKALAAQTARATDQIGAQIVAIRAATNEAVGAVREVSAAIGQVDSVATAIAAAVEQQAAATQEISSSVQTVTLATSSTAAAMDNVRTITEGTDAASQSVLTVADEVGSSADTLRVEVHDFLTAMTRHDDDDRRAYERLSGGGATASLSIRHGSAMTAAIQDISRGGVALRCDANAAAGTEAQVDLPAGGSVFGRVVRTGNGVVVVSFRQDAASLMRVDQALAAIGKRALATAA